MVGVDGLGELVERWWNLESLHEDSLLSLNENVSWPSDESGQISLWLNSSSDSESLWSAFEESVLLDDLLLG